jgi:VanZ family protein
LQHSEEIEDARVGRCHQLDGKVIFVLGLGLVLGFPFFFWGGPGYHSARSFKAAWDLGHILFFALASVLAILLARQRGIRTEWQFALALIVLGVGCGILIEIAQLGVGGRSVDCWDVYRDLLGILTALVFCGILPGSLHLRRGFLFVCALLLFSSIGPLAVALVDEYLADRQFPVLADFETPFEEDRFVPAGHVQRSGTFARSGRHSLHVRLTTATYSGVSLFYFPHNWEGYEQLHFSVYNPSRDRLVLHCRIHDRWHKDHGMVYRDRFHQAFPLVQGWNDCRVSLEAVHRAPAEREMDMKAIESFALFVVRQDRSRVLYLDHIFLSR